MCIRDSHIGRVIDYVNKKIDRETIIIFVSDNGAEGNAINEMGDNKHWIPATFDNRIENMGKRDSYVWLGAGWAQAMVSPYKIYKSYTTQGGIKSPAIFFSTKNRFKNSKKNSVMTVMDIAPTILEVAGVAYPDTAKKGILPMTGRSALNFLTDKSDSIHNNQPIGWELYGNRALIKGKYKAVLTWPPEGSGKWELFDTQEDPTESTDISKDNEILLRELIADWSNYAEENGVAIIDKDIGYGRYP